jgi:hypothetical protein
VTNNFKALAVGVALAASLAAVSPASAVTIVKPFLGGPFTGGDLGTIAAIKLLKANTYDFTFTLLPGAGPVLTQLQASVSGPVSEPIQFTLFSGTPGSGAFVDMSTLMIGPSLTDSLTAGSYYVQVDFIAQNKELLTGGLQVSAIPEPGAWALMLIGFGGMGLALRRRSAKLASATA